MNYEITIENFKNILKNNNIFLTGGAGTGKSFLIRELIKDLEINERKKVVKLGSTGVSSVNIGGMTIHSFFALGIVNSLEELKLKDSYQKSYGLVNLEKLIKNTDYIIIDEISMVSAELFTMISYRLEQFNFKGRLIVVGDFFQLPPINKNTVDDKEFAFESDNWEDFKFQNIYLKNIKRTNNKEFSILLNKLRVGEVSNKDFEFIKNLKNNKVDESKSVILVSTNKRAKEINYKNLADIESPELNIKLEYQLFKPNMEKKLQKFIESSPFEETLKIKVGAKVIFTKNSASGTSKFYNGEIGTVKDILYVNNNDNNSYSTDYILKIITERNEEVYLYPQALEDVKYKSVNNEVIADRNFVIQQFPIKLAYAITIHKSQGMSINNLIYDSSYIFDNSQFYVALSRGVDPEKISIIYKNFNKPFEQYILNKIITKDKIKDFYNNIENELLDNNKIEDFIEKEEEKREEEINIFKEKVENDFNIDNDEIF